MADTIKVLDFRARHFPSLGIAALTKLVAMASLTKNDKPPSSPQKADSPTSTPARKFEDFEAYARAHMYDPPHREKRPSVEGLRKPGGPCRITRDSNGVLTEYGKKVEEQDRLYHLAKTTAANKEDETKEGGAGQAAS